MWCFETPEKNMCDEKDWNFGRTTTGSIRTRWPPTRSWKPEFVTNNMVLIRHIPYSPDLAPCDFALFSNWKYNWRDDVLEHWQTTEGTYSTQLSKITSRVLLKSGKKRWDHCISSQRDYFEDGSQNCVRQHLFLDLVQKLSDRTSCWRLKKVTRNNEQRICPTCREEKIGIIKWGMNRATNGRGRHVFNSRAPLYNEDALFAHPCWHQSLCPSVCITLSNSYGQTNGYIVLW
jgi:hypothetical protein